MIEPHSYYARLKRKAIEVSKELDCKDYLEEIPNVKSSYFIGAFLIKESPNMRILISSTTKTSYIASGFINVSLEEFIAELPKNTRIKFLCDLNIYKELPYFKI